MAECNATLVAPPQVMTLDLNNLVEEEKHVKIQGQLRHIGLF
jgi:hypothetical protein